MTHPAVSVIVPVYNVEKYLSRCLDSILTQSFLDIEVICVDDGSTDSSSEILRRYAAQDERIRVITQENRGLSGARNTGLDAATGEWIAFVDSDDEVSPEIWKTLLDEAGDESAICFSSEEVCVADKREYPVHCGYNKVKFSGYKIIKDEELVRISMTVWDKIYRRSNIEATKIRFPEGLHFEDNVFVMNFFVINRQVRFIHRILYYYHRNNSSIMHSVRTHKSEIVFDYIKILDSVYHFWKQHNLLPQKQAVFESICLNCFCAAIKWCQPWERTGIAYAMAKSFHGWGIKPQRQEFRALYEGNFSIHLARFWRKEITMLKPLKGLQKILYIGNCQGKKILCVFGIRVLAW